jgi:hypothetical protein
MSEVQTIKVKLVRAAKVAGVYYSIGDSIEVNKETANEFAQIGLVDADALTRAAEVAKTKTPAAASKAAASSQKATTDSKSK